MNKRAPKPATSPWLSPILTVREIEPALAFYDKAFGFEKRFALPGPDGKIVHAEIGWQETSFMMGCEGTNNPCKAPVTTGVRPAIALYVYCADVDAMYKRATAAGAKSDSEPEDMFWGDRVCSVIDPDGYVWFFGTNKADFDPSKVPGGC